ncbi:hypothetical protein [Rhizobium wenxiniae]|uniref:hypothetical protein n=1 Tax=Rhizobium wenxiniae TaxID=1737357 RepID=UPI001C6E0603|nr:hypothetical protein [Rhizobium wenxiniae]
MNKSPATERQLKMVSITSTSQTSISTPYRENRKSETVPDFNNLLEQGTSSSSEKYDFSSMSRQEIADAGQHLFQRGEITIDDMFRFQHPDGRLHLDTSGNRTELDPSQQINFIDETRSAITNMEMSGEASREKSGYKLMVELLDKLEGKSID